MTFLRYIAIQFLAYGLDMGIFLMMFNTGTFGPVLANLLAKLSAGFFAFLAHRRFTFQVSEFPSVAQQATRYFILFALNVPVASAILALLLVWITEPIMTKFIADIVGVAISYQLSKHYIFTRQQDHVEKYSRTGGRQ